MEQVKNLLLSNDPQGQVRAIEFMEGFLYHREHSPAKRFVTEVNSRASSVVNQVIYGPAVLVLRGRKGAQLFNLLRLSLLKQPGQRPLSSDAFTPFGRHDQAIHNAEVCFQ
mgnify:CR=1 FL=1